MSKLKAAEQMHQVASDERQEEMQMRSALEQQISQVRLFHNLVFLLGFCHLKLFFSTF